MRWTPLEVDLWRSLEALAAHPGQRFLVGPPGREDEAALVGLVIEEGRRFHEVERDVAHRRSAHLAQQAGVRADGIEFDRAGRGDPRSLPGDQEIRARLEENRKRSLEHEAALVRLARPEAESAVRTTLRGFELRPRAELEALKARAGSGQVVELFSDGWPFRPTLAERLAARREMLGLPAGKDWV